MRTLIFEIIRDIDNYRRYSINGKPLPHTEYGNGWNDGLTKALETIIFKLPSKEYEKFKHYIEMGKK